MMETTCEFFSLYNPEDSWSWIEKELKDMLGNRKNETKVRLCLGTFCLSLFLNQSYSNHRTIRFLYQVWYFVRGTSS